MQISFLPICKLYFILHLSSFSHIPSQKSTEKKPPCCPQPPYFRLFQRKEKIEKGKRKKRTTAAI